MKQFNIAIIGQGRSGRDIHGLHLKKDTERFRVVAVVEKLEKRMNRAAEEYGCDVYDDYTKLFERNDIDLVVNSSPSHLHYAITKDLLSHGLNVLCEKPCVPTVEEFDDLCATAKENGCHFLVFQQSRFANYFLKVKEVIASGVLGRIVHVGIQFNGFARRWDWQCCLDFNGGNLANTGPHPVDQALNILDAYDKELEIFCKMDRCNTFGNAEDYVKLIVTAPDRPLIDLDISSCDAYPSYTYKVEGTNGTLKGSMAHIDWKYFKPVRGQVEVLRSQGGARAEADPHPSLRGRGADARLLRREAHLVRGKLGRRSPGTLHRRRADLLRSDLRAVAQWQRA